MGLPFPSTPAASYDLRIREMTRNKRDLAQMINGAPDNYTELTIVHLSGHTSLFYFRAETPETNKIRRLTQEATVDVSYSPNGPPYNASNTNWESMEVRQTNFPLNSF